MRPGRRHPDGLSPGAALLEVVLALALFFMAVSVISGGLGTSLRAAARLREQSVAADLAVSAASELQMGLRELVDQGPDALADDGPLADWTCQIDVEPVQNIEGMLDVRVVITNELTGRSRQLAFWMPGETEPPAEEFIEDEALYDDAGGGR